MSNWIFFQAKYHQSSLVWFGLFGSILISLPRFIYSLLLGTSVLEHLRVLPSNQIRIFILPPNRFSNWVKVIITRWILDELILSSPLESLLTQINLITTRVKGPSNGPSFFCSFIEKSTFQDPLCSFMNHDSWLKVAFEF